jgi:hypothetical protein
VEEAAFHASSPVAGADPSARARAIEYSSLDTLNAGTAKRDRFTVRLSEALSDQRNKRRPGSGTPAMCPEIVRLRTEAGTTKDEGRFADDASS